MNTKNTRAMSVEPDPHAELAVQGDAGLAAPVAHKDCPRHSWLIDPGATGENDPCPECANGAEMSLALAEVPSAKVQFCIGGENSTALVLTLHATSCGGDEQKAIERHRAFFMSHFSGLRFEKVDVLPRTFTAADIRKAFLAGSQWAIRAVASESDTAPEAAADTYLASL